MLPIYNNISFHHLCRIAIYSLNLALINAGRGTRYSRQFTTVKPKANANVTPILKSNSRNAVRVAESSAFSLPNRSAKNAHPSAYRQPKLADAAERDSWVWIVPGASEQFVIESRARPL